MDLGYWGYDDFDRLIGIWEDANFPPSQGM
jgi:hypothetical protein